MINLDKAATTAPNRRFLEDIRTLAEDYYNPSSANSCSIEVKRKIERVRKQVADLINTTPEHIYFVSGASEGNAMLADGNWDYEQRWQTVVEHPSLGNNWGVDQRINVDHNGKVNEDWYKNIPYRGFISVGYANSETGVIQDIKEISRRCHQFGDAFFMSDLTTVVGKIPVDVTDLDLDGAVFSGHKFHALKGVGVVYIKDEDVISPIIYGTQENGMRGGTLNSLAILSLGYAIEDIDYDRYNEHATKLRERLLSDISQYKQVKINSPAEDCLPSIINLYIDLPISAQNVVEIFDEYGIIVSAGTACAAFEEKPSKTLLAMGFDEERVRKSIRVSWDEENTIEDIDRFADILGLIINLYSE